MQKILEETKDVGDYKTLKEFATKIWEDRLGDRWNVISKDTFHGTGWSIAIDKSELKDPAKGVDQRTTKVYTFAQRPDGETVEKVFGPISSPSWKENEQLLYPQINAWCKEISGNNPLLKYD